MSLSKMAELDDTIDAEGETGRLRECGMGTPTDPARSDLGVGARSGGEEALGGDM
jgi:hypothetical protein